jgi:hypothetical protein
MSSRKLNVEKLKNASDHLWYEIWMFQTLVQGMASGVAGKEALNNAMLESLAIHVRALIDFFYSDNPQRDDVVADHFFAEPSKWRSVLPAKTAVLAQAKKRADKEVAHLTYARQKVTPEKKSWHFLPIFNDLQAAISAFLSTVPRELLGPRWAGTISRASGQNGAA